MLPFSFSFGNGNAALNACRYQYQLILTFSEEDSLRSTARTS